PRDIPLNIDMKKKDICMICKSVIDPSLKDSITILSYKHFYYKECIERANISTSLTEFTEPTFTESIESTEPTFTESTEPTFTKSTESTKLIESIESTESNGMLVKFTELTTSFILIEYTESIASVDSTDFTSAPIELIEYAEANQMVIRSWYEFADELDKQINQTLRNQKKSKHRSSKKSATSEVYDKLLNHFTDMTRVALRKRVEK
ncbi:7962_t:CDS:2, partial [Racocetra persica]